MPGGLSMMSIRIPMHDYKSLHVAVVILVTEFNRNSIQPS